MLDTNRFAGLTMPVFSAFGWAGEEAAMKFALSQLEIFIQEIFASLPRETQNQLPTHGLDRSSGSVYLAVSQPPEEGPYIAFLTRPMSLEISLNVTNKAALTKLYRTAQKQLPRFSELLRELGSDWSLRIQQNEYDEEAGTSTHYQDLYKGSVGDLGEEALPEIVDRAEFLNSEGKWIVPFFVSARTDSEKAAAMGQNIVRAMGEKVRSLMPLIGFMTGQRRPVAPKTTTPAPPKPERPAVVVESTVVRRPSEAAQLEQFTYVSELKPLHIRRGFVNLTPNHWPFFAKTARSETRRVSLTYDGKTDKDCAVWHLASSNQARVVLSPAVHDWLEHTFSPDELIQVTAVKESGDKISVALAPVG